MILILLSDISWTGLHQRPHHVALALSRQWRILWVEPITTGARIRLLPEEVEKNITVVSLPEIPYNARQHTVRRISQSLSTFGVVRAMISWLQGLLLREALRRLGVEGEQRGVVMYSFTLIDVAAKLKPVFTHFEYIDNVFGFTTFPAHVRGQWVRTLQQVDAVTVSSPALARQVEPVRGSTVQVVGNGVEYARFAEKEELPRPADLPAGKPIVAYSGAVYPWLDYGLLREVCLRCTDLNFVFVGPVHPDVSTHVRSLNKLGNVQFLGARPYTSIPAYLQHVDVCMIPFQKNELTTYVNPVKLYEYCAAGKPCVVTDFSEDVVAARDHIVVASSREEFLRGLREALAGSKDHTQRAALQSFARQHDWNAKTSAIIDLIRYQIAARGKD